MGEKTSALVFRGNQKLYDPSGAKTPQSSLLDIWSADMLVETMWVFTMLVGSCVLWPSHSLFLFAQCVIADLTPSSVCSFICLRHHRNMARNSQDAALCPRRSHA